MQPPLPPQQPQQPRQAPTRRASEQLDDNATLTSLDIEVNTIGDKGARALAAVLVNSSALMALIGDHNNIGAQGARELVAAQDTNRRSSCTICGTTASPRTSRTSRPTAWIASALAGRVELCDDELVPPRSLAARAAVLAFGDEPSRSNRT